MSREIKFRGKVKYNGNHYFSGEWVYGFYFIDEQDNHYIIDSTPDEFGNARFSHVQVIPETAGQYTGLKDKNGVEIYEGDVVYLAGFGELIVEDFGFELWDAVKSGNGEDIGSIIGNIHTLDTNT